MLLYMINNAITTINKDKENKNSSISVFGINDCNKPIRNTQKNVIKSKINKTQNKKMNGNIKRYNYKTIILFPQNLGQKKTGTEKAPLQINQFINNKTHIIKKIKNSGNLFTNINKLYKLNNITKGKIINIGGDHSMCIATIADTLNKYPDAKIIYFDAHADINTYKSSNSKNYHGMPLSFITGIDKDVRFNFIKNILPFENLLYVGSRCFDKFEVSEIYKKNIKFITSDEINNNFTKSLKKIIDFVGKSPIHISFDVDSIDPKYIPSTGTPVKNGIELNNAITILDHLNNKNIVKLDISELNLDIGSKNDSKKSIINTEHLFHKFLS